jgi:hypothetical protein
MSRTTGETHELALPAGEATRPELTRDGSALLYSGPPSNGVPWQLYRVPVAGKPPAVSGTPELITSGFRISDCGDAYAFVEPSATGWRVLTKTRAGVVTPLYTSAPGQFVLDMHCGPRGTRVAFVLRDSIETGGKLIVVDRRGQARTLIDDGTVNEATFANETSLIASRRLDNHTQLYEIPIDGGEPRQLTFDDGAHNAPAVTPDGRFLAFTRDTSVWLPFIASGTTQRRLVSQRVSCTYLRAVTADLAVGQCESGRGDEVVTVRLSDGVMVPLAPGAKPFPAFDRSTIYFVDSRNHAVLDGVPVAGGPVTAVATAPGAISWGSAGPDGIHVLVGRTHPKGYRLVAGREPEPEVDNALVTTAPSGGWRAVTDLSRTPATLRLVPPGAALDHPVKELPTDLIYSEWLDDHRIGVCSNETCSAYDVDTGASTLLASTGSGPMMSVMPDGRILTSEIVPHVTEHVITNFAAR